MLNIALLLSACLVFGEETKTFKVFDVPDDLPPYDVVATAALLDCEPAEECATNFCQRVRTFMFKETSNAARVVSLEELPRKNKCTLYSAEGLVVQYFAELTEGMELYVVPKGRLFVWPSNEIGHKVTVKTNDNELVVETLSTAPRVFRLHNFVSEEEVQELHQNAEDADLERSTGGIAPKGSNATNGGSVIKSRTSTNAWDTDSDISMKIKRRTASLLRLPGFDKEQYGGLQIVHYETGQFYDFHQDWMEKTSTPNWNWDPKEGGVNRFATVFLYLTDTELGGATGFPMSNTPVEEEDPEETAEIKRLQEELFTPGSMEWKAVDECRLKFHVKPRRGDAVLFYHQDRIGNLDRNALHGACPVLKGEKLGANLWIWNDKMFTHERAEGKGESMNCLFSNSYGAPIELYWIQNEDHTGWMNLVFNSKLDTGGSFSSGTYSGHSFLAKNMDGEILGKWEMKTQVTRIDIQRGFPQQSKEEL